MSDRLTSFLVSLATDPDRMQRFAQNAEAELDAAGLDATERAAVLSRDTMAIRRALGEGAADHMTQMGHRTKKKGVAKGGKKKPAAGKAKNKTK